MSIKLEEIEFYAGERPGSPPLLLRPGSVVILVGPNNSGKSLALREIESLNNEANQRTVVVKSVKHYIPTAPELESLVSHFRAEPPSTQNVPPGHIYIAQHTFKSDQQDKNAVVDLARLQSAAPAKQMGLLRAWLFSFYTIRLDGRTRFGLTDAKPTGDLQSYPKNHLWALFKDDAAREKVRELTEKAFGLHFVIDPTAMTQFRIRMSTKKPASRVEEQGLDERARAFHGEARLISELSDGVQAFVGLVSAVLSLQHKIILIDEPEAFLHPPLARRLGADLAKIAKERGATLIVSTHSAPFVLGCVEGNDFVSIARLTYESGTATARNIESAEIKKLFKSALLRSTGVVQGLFHRAIVVCESDTDRSFYDEINRRLNSEQRGIADAHFVNAQNKQTVCRIVGPMRKLGLPAVAVVDLDVLKCRGADWANLVKACGIPEAVNERLKVEREYFEAIFLGLGKNAGQPDPFKRGGAASVPPAERNRFQAFLQEMALYGLFVVPGGELESWLLNLSVGSKGTDWLLGMLNVLGDSEDDPAFMRPGANDVWAFLDSIGSWVTNQQRLGV